MFASLFDLYISMKNTRGSIPQGGRKLMNKRLNAKKTALRFVLSMEEVFSSWVAKAILLALGLWSVFPRPNINNP